MSSYLQGAGSRRRTPQHAPIPGREAEMVSNDAGGFTFQVGPLETLRRFLILGTESGTYYANPEAHTARAAGAVREVIDRLGLEAVNEIVTVSQAGRAPKVDPAIFALAVAAGSSHEVTRRAALDALPLVCRTGSHLLMFAALIEEQRGWGRGLRRAVGNWYLRDLDDVAYQVVKYRQRGGWSHRDLLRLAKPRPERGGPHDALFGWVVGKTASGGQQRAVDAFCRAQTAGSPAATAALIREYDGLLPREALLSDHLTDPDVWKAMLDVGIPMTALIRNLVNLTRYGVIGPLSPYNRLIAEQLTDPVRLARARIHPLQVLVAMTTYAGKGDFWVRPVRDWTPQQEIVDALNEAFYASFGMIEPTGKRTMIGLDVSGSMHMQRIGGLADISAAQAATVMAMVTARVGDPYIIYAFGETFEPLEVSPRQRLDDILRRTQGIDFGRTDCALPMLEALDRRLEVDTFVIYTDNETWFGDVHPKQALDLYRASSGIDARCIVVGMTATQFTIADPSDAGMLDVVGFDTAAPSVIAGFSGRSL